MVGRGKYHFREQYTHLQVPESRWFKMTKDQRRAHLHKVGCLQSIWQKADELLNSLGSIVSAPGHSEQATMVLSHSGNPILTWYYLAKVGDINAITASALRAGTVF